MDPRGDAPARILALLRDGPRQAHDLAGDLGMETSGIRRHLEMLRGDGLVAREQSIEGRGRPKVRYALTEVGWETFPRDYARILGLVLERVERRDGREGLLALLGDLARDVASEVPAGASADARLRNLIGTYNALGFEASLEPAPDSRGDLAGGERVVLVQRNCIALRAARADPEAFCDCFDEGIIRAALPGATVRLGECMATGGAMCRHEIELPRGARVGRPQA